MYCYEDHPSNYTIDCPRSCPMDCMDTDTDLVCASDLGTYSGSCDMKMKVCELYAREHLDNGDMIKAAEVLENITVINNEACPSKKYSFRLFLDGLRQYVDDLHFGPRLYPTVSLENALVRPTVYGPFINLSLNISESAYQFF